MDNPINKTGVSAVWGGRGAGKTTLSQKEILPQLDEQRIVVIDPMSLTGHKTARSAVEALYAGEKRIVLATSNRHHAIPMIYACWAHSTKDDPIYIICDEAPEYLDKDTDGLSKIMFQGRHRGFGMLLLGQRPNALSAQIRSQIESTFWMRQIDHTDIETARKMIGPEKAARLPAMKAGEFIRHPERTENETK